MTGVSTATPFSRVGIVGFGLMGGSLARSLRGLSAPPFVRVLSLNRVELEEGLEAGVIDEVVGEPEKFVEGLDLIVYCTPLTATLSLLDLHSPFLDPVTLITDMVSLKVPVIEKVWTLGLESAFVGSHPMTGSEGTGFGASREGLFLDARVWVVPGKASGDAVARIHSFWTSVGALPAAIDASEHDTLMAWISHIPQITANVLASVLGEAGIRREALGPGGKDMTRLSGSGPEMWRDLLEHAPDVLPEALEAVEKALSEVRTQVRTGRGSEVADTMERTRRWFKGEPWN